MVNCISVNSCIDNENVIRCRQTKKLRMSISSLCDLLENKLKFRSNIKKRKKIGKIERTEHIRVIDQQINLGSHLKSKREKQRDPNILFPFLLKNDETSFNCNFMKEKIYDKPDSSFFKYIEKLNPVADNQNQIKAVDVSSINKNIKDKIPHNFSNVKKSFVSTSPAFKNSKEHDKKQLHKLVPSLFESNIKFDNFKNNYYNINNSSDSLLKKEVEDIDLSLYGLCSTDYPKKMLEDIGKTDFLCGDSTPCPKNYKIREKDLSVISKPIDFLTNSLLKRKNSFHDISGRKDNLSSCFHDDAEKLFFEDIKYCLAENTFTYNEDVFDKKHIQKTEEKSSNFFSSTTNTIFSQANLFSPISHSTPSIARFSSSKLNSK